MLIDKSKKLFISRELIEEASVDPRTRKLDPLEMIPTQINHLKVNNASTDDALWLNSTLAAKVKNWGAI